MKKIKIYYSFILLFFCSVLMGGFVQAQEKMVVKGKVVSLVDNTPLEDINVRVVGVAKLFEATNANGEFTIEVPSPLVTMEFSYPNYKQYTVFLNGNSNILVKMVPEGYPSLLDGIVVADKTQQKRFIAEAVTGLNDTKFRERAFATIDHYLTGRVAGLQVTSFNGAPGVGVDLVLRGRTSIYAGNSPLYVVDGVMVNTIQSDNLSLGSFNSELLYINPGDVESVTVLKDAAAKAMYGARGANGVVMIDTYKGQKGNSKIDFTINSGIKSVDNTISLLDADEHRHYMMEMAGSELGSINLVRSTYGRYIFNDPTSDLYQKYNNSTNWQDELLNQALYSNSHFRIRGGDDISKYTFSVGYYDEEGVIENSDLNRLSARFSLDYSINDRLTYGNSISFSKVTQNQQMQAGARYNPLLQALRKTPITTIYQQSIDGVDKPVFADYDFLGISNPYAMASGIKNKKVVTSINGRVFGEYKANERWNGYASISLDHVSQQDIVFIPALGVAPYNDKRRISDQIYDKQTFITSKIEADYNNRIDYVHDISAKVGVEMLVNEFKHRRASTYNSNSDDFTSLGQGLYTDTLSSENVDWSMISAYVNARYQYKEKYLAKLTVRADGSSRFGVDNRVIVFPALGLGWRIAKEDFMKDVPWIDELKLRASYGVTGNHNIGNYSSRLLYVPANYKNLGGVALGQVANEELKPEMISEFNLGIDWSIFNERLNLSVDLYDRTNNQLLVYDKMPQFTGFPYAIVNGGKVNNKGIELALGTRIFNGNFKWDIDATVAFNNNAVTELPERTSEIITNYNGITSKVSVGRALGEYYGYVFDGVYATDAEASLYQNGDVHGYSYDAFKGGDVRFKDLDGNNIIDENDQAYLGNSSPDIFGSFSTRISYKGFELSAMIDYQLGREVVNGMRMLTEGMSDFSNQNVAVNRRWMQQGDQTNMPRLVYGDPAGNNRFSSRWIESGDFVRLRNVTLSYTLPKQMTQKLHLQQIRLFVSGENLLTITDYLGYDPEFNHLNNALLSGVDYVSTPLTRSFSAGIKIGL
ncbi:SusC/RagA family TonB-linked outer membrane protein [Prolixibacteraceae bacterium JC049]|nr:SusC/RagA family TonB-linked outer membrane protein [Prolixibacteraceae bacterium JC049]